MKKSGPQLKAVLVGALVFSIASLGAAATYYVHPILGKDANEGTSPQAPFRTLEQASRIRLEAGDQVLLAAGQTFAGQLAYEKLTGSATNPIIISSYPSAPAADDTRPTIDARGYVAGVFLKNCAHVKIGNLLITANAGGMKRGQPETKGMRCGVLIEADQPGNYAGFSVSNLVVKDVFFEEPGFVRPSAEVKSANGTQSYGWGIRFLISSPGAIMRDIAIADCEIENVDHTGLKLTAPNNGLLNVDVQHVCITNSGGPGVQMSGVYGGHFSHLDVNRSGSTNDTRNWSRGSGLWTWGSSDVVIEKSRFQNANGPGDSAGVHIDYNCRNVIVQYNLSANNAGGFCEILGNNYNCAYRYNVSVNDGYRVKGKNGAFQAGKIFWLSGYTGDKSRARGPFNSYFYNNTIYVGPDIVAKVAVADSAQGVLIANNIFYIAGRSESVLGDQNKPDHGKAAGFPNVSFENNLYLHADNWPTSLPIQDHSPIVGNPQFRQAGGIQTQDYIPQNIALIQDRGIAIRQLPQDKAGLISGLKVEADILGNRIGARPDLGAIEVKRE